MKAFVSALAAIVVISVGANVFLTEVENFSSQSVYQSSSVRLGE